MQNSLFKSVFDAYNQVQFQKNLKNSFREKFKNVDFGSTSLILDIIRILF